MLTFGLTLIALAWITQYTKMFKKAKVHGVDTVFVALYALGTLVIAADAYTPDLTVDFALYLVILFAALGILLIQNRK